jgi:hypothetical protein
MVVEHTITGGRRVVCALDAPRIDWKLGALGLIVLAVLFDEQRPPPPSVNALAWTTP